MGKRIKLTKTDVFLLGLTVLFVLAMVLTWLLTPRQVRGGYDISAVPPEEAAPALLKVNIFWAVSGPVLAQRIVDEREANGPYTGAEDLTRVEGIGQAIVESIQDHIITEDTQE